jgi:type IV pilus assembly protein PilQ
MKGFFMWCKRALLFCCLLIFFIAPGTVHGEKISLDLQNIPLTDAVRELGKFLQLNLLVSPAISGNISLQLHGAEPGDAFNLLLDSQGLSKTQRGDVWYVAPRAEMMARREEDFKFQETLTATALLQTRVWQMHYAKAEDVGHLLQDASASLLSARGHVRIDARTNTLCVQDTATHLRDVFELIKKLDVPVKQILIEARLASVDSDFERELGISFTAKSALANANKGGVLAEINPHHFSLAVATLANGSYLDVALAAMENAGKGELISNPSLYTANQQTASIESGEEIPYQEVSVSGGTATTFKKAVLSLKVTPQIMPGGKVLLQLQINQDRPSTLIVQGVPAITTRQLVTNILVNNGQTLVLGGIYEQNNAHAVERIPFLSKIPLLGLLFQQQDVKINKRELLIFVTPKIIS